MKLRHSKLGRRGVALLLTLMVISIVSAGVVAFVRLAHIEASVAENLRDFTQAEIQAEAGLQAAMTAISADRNNFDAQTDLWGRFEEISPLLDELFEDAKTTGRVIDLSSRININFLLNQNGMININRLNQLTRLFTILKLDPDPIPAIEDWLDRDDDPRQGGAENNYYLNLPKPYRSGNGQFITVGQIALVKGMTPEILLGKENAPGLLDYITVHSDGKININTASEAVLMCLDDGISKSVAEDIIRRRKTKPFNKLDEVREVPGLDPAVFARIIGYLSVQTSNFLIRVDSRHRDANVSISGVAHRQQGTVRLIYFRQG